MVLVPESGGVEVQIYCDGVPLPEYAISINGRNVTCHVPSKVGQKFEIRGKRSARGSEILACYMYLDGATDSADAKFLYCEQNEIFQSIGVRTGASTRKTFTFGNLILSEDEDEVLDVNPDALKGLGSIRVKLRYVEYKGIVPWKFHHNLDSQVRSGPVHEKSKKGGSHIVALGEEISTKMRLTVARIKQLPFNDHNVTFQYAPEDYLRAQEIIPTPPVARLEPVSNTSRASQAVPSVKREHVDSEDLTSDAILSDEEDAAAYARLKAKIEASRRKKKVKLEVSEIPSGVFQRGEVIDLTGDD